MTVLKLAVGAVIGAAAMLGGGAAIDAPLARADHGCAIPPFPPHRISDQWACIWPAVDTGPWDNSASATPDGSIVMTAEQPPMPGGSEVLTDGPTTPESSIIASPPPGFPADYKQCADGRWRAPDLPCPVVCPSNGLFIEVEAIDDPNWCPKEEREIYQGSA